MFTSTGFYTIIKTEYHLQGDVKMADFNGGWIKFYSEFADVILKYRNNRNELIRIIKKVFESIDMKLPKTVTIIGNDNLGLFLYSIIQIAILSCTLAYSIKYMIKNMKISNRLGIIFLGIYALVPIFPFYAMSAVKDVIFSSFVLLYVIMLHKIIVNEGNGIKLKEYLLMLLLDNLLILYNYHIYYICCIANCQTKFIFFVT